MPLSDEENKKLQSYLAMKNDLIRQPKGNVAKYQNSVDMPQNVFRSQGATTVVPQGGEIDQALKPQTQTQDAGLGGMAHLAGGGFISDDDPELKDTLTAGTSTPPLLAPPQTPSMEPHQPDEPSDTEQNVESKVADSHPGHTSEDLSGLSNYIQSQEAQADKYGPEQEQAVLNQILKERGGIGRNIGRGIAAFTDTAGPAFGAGTGTLKSLDDRENEMEKARLESVPTLQGMNEKRMGQKMALEGMDPSSPLGKSTSGTLQTVMKQLFPNMSPDQLNKLTQNPTVIQKLFPDLGALLEKQNMSDLKKMEVEQGAERLKAEEANQLSGRKLEEQKMGVEHPILKAFGKLPSVLPGGATSYTPDVTAYAQKHGITPEQANQIKMKRTGQ